MASSIFGGRPSLDKAISTLSGMGVDSAKAGDEFMTMLYRTNPQVRRILDQYEGKSIDDLLESVGVDPKSVKERFGIKA